MKKELGFIKIMFWGSVLFTALFVAIYIWGLFNCANFGDLLDATLPFCGLTVLSVIGFGIAQTEYVTALHERAKANMRIGRSTQKKLKKEHMHDNFHMIKVYDRNMGYHSKQIRLRSSYGMLKSA